LNIASVVNIDELQEYVETLDVENVEQIISLCAGPGADLIKNKVQEHNLDRVIVAACTPMTHERVFQKVIEEVGLNSGYLEFVNIREHCSYVHEEDKEKAMRQAKDLLLGAVMKARYLEDIPTKTIDVIPKVLIVGGGVAGLNAAMDLVNEGIETILVEEKPTIGGHMAKLDRTYPTDDCSI
jgi:heterodisulfide reductase subunit A